MHRKGWPDMSVSSVTTNQHIHKPDKKCLVWWTELPVYSSM